jgi:hypothetical protein
VPSKSTSWRVRGSAASSCRVGKAKQCASNVWQLLKFAARQGTGEGETRDRSVQSKQRVPGCDRASRRKQAPTQLERLNGGFHSRPRAPCRGSDPKVSRSCQAGVDLSESEPVMQLKAG